MSLHDFTALGDISSRWKVGSFTLVGIEFAVWASLR